MFVNCLRRPFLFRQPPIASHTSEEEDGGAEQWYRTKDGLVVRNVRQPALIAFLPDPDKATGAALEALRLLHAGADKWSLDRDRIGMIGLSAGAMTALNVIEEERPWGPDFLGYIYGPMDADLTADDLLPMLAAIARDDELILDRSFSFVDSWKAHGGEAEMHVYRAGGHGFGLGRGGTDSARFKQDLLEWLDRQVSAGDPGR